MSTIFVTGGTGFVGSHLVKNLASQHHVKCLVRPSTLARLSDELRSLKQVQWISGDLNDQDALAMALRDVDQVYHVAGVTKAVNSADFQRVNQNGTRQVLQACAVSVTAKRVLLVSSLAAAGPAPGGVPLVETQPATPVSQYGRSKLAAEQVAQSFADRLSITIVRPPIVLGPGDRDGFEMFRAIWRTGIHLVPGYRKYRVSLIHVTDLVQAMESLMSTGETLASIEEPGRGIYYVAVDETPTYAELGKLIGLAVEMPRVIAVPAPFFAVFGAAAISTLVSRITQRPSILNIDKIREAQAGHWTCSNAKWKATCCDKPQFGLQATLKMTAEWYREQGWLK